MDDSTGASVKDLIQNLRTHLEAIQGSLINYVIPYVERIRADTIELRAAVENIPITNAGIIKGVDVFVLDPVLKETEGSFEDPEHVEPLHCQGSIGSGSDFDLVDQDELS